jgi:hypothetical protein
MQICGFKSPKFKSPEKLILIASIVPLPATINTPVWMDGHTE